MNPTNIRLRPQWKASWQQHARQVFQDNKLISVVKVAAFLCLPFLVITNLIAQKAIQNPTRDFSHSIGQIPIFFEQNDGQADDAVKFVALNGRFKAWITRDGLVFPRGNTFISMQVRDALVTTFQPEEQAVGVSNYYLGPRILEGLKHYGRVRGHNIRPGIDIVFHSDETELEYDFEVRPGGRPELLRLGFGGTRSLDLEANGDIRILSGNDGLRLRKPTAWQGTADHRRLIGCDYRIAADGDVELILGPYDHSRQLTIDPIISFSTYLSSGGNDILNAVAVDTTGIYVTGNSLTSNFPVTSGTDQGNPGLFVTKFNSSGTALLYSTIIAGGSGQAIAADGSGNVYVAGTTGAVNENQHIFVAKLNSSGQTAYTTVLAGNQTEQAGAIAIDSSGAAYVAGTSNSSNFPVTAGALQTTLSGTGDVVVAKLSASGQVIYATYLGGSNYDSANGIAVDSAGDAYVVGSTASSDYPTTTGAYITSFPVGPGVEEGFVTEINPTGTAIVSSTLLGGSESDTNLESVVTGITRDTSGYVYVAGWSNATDFPSSFSVSKGQPVFVTKFNSSLSSTVYSVTVGMGSTPQQSPAIAVDQSGASYVSVTGIPQSVITNGGFDTGAVGNLSFFVVAPSGDALSYAGQFGSGGELTTSIAVDGSGGIYLGGFTSTANFPTTSGAYQTVAQPKVDGNYLSGLLVRVDLTSPTSCITSLGPTPTSSPNTGGSFSFDFTIPSGCPWGVAPDSGYQTAVLTGQTVGISSGATVPVNGTLPPNPYTSQRTVDIFVSEKAVSITQPGSVCYQPVISPLPLTVDATGDGQNISVTLPYSCEWHAVANVPWLSFSNLIAGGLESGSNNITLSATPFSYSVRTGTVTISNETFTVTQMGTGTCTASASATQPTPANSGGTGAILISVNQNSCSWSGYSLVPWIQVAAASGQGNGSLPYTVAANPGVNQRSGQILVADQLVTITQAAGPAGAITGYTASLFAGGNSMYEDGVPAIESAVGSPDALFYDAPTGNFYFADQQYQKIRVITPDGTINTVAPNLPIAHPTAITVDPSGNIYIGDGGVVWGVTQNGPFAGTGVYGFGGDGGPATSAQLTLVSGLAADSSTVYISDEYNARIRAVSNGTITTIAGGGTIVHSNGDPATRAKLVGPQGLVLDTAGDLVFGDGNAIRTVSQGIINTRRVTSGSLSDPQAMAYDVAGNLFITEIGVPLVELAPAGKISSVPLPIVVQTASGIATDPAGNLYVGDGVNHAVWKLTPQSFCTYTVATPGALPIAGGSLNLNVGTGAGCNWTAISDIPWITVSAGSSGSGNGTVQLTIASNAIILGSHRTGSIAIAGQVVSITQEGPPGDFAGTSHTDLLWQDNSTGQVAIWYLGGSPDITYQSWAWLAAGSMSGWTMIGAADFNGDGNPDLIWQRNSTRQVAVWYMGGAEGNTYQSWGWLAAGHMPGWTLICAADVNGDGHPDLIWQNDTTGQVTVWYMSGLEGNTYQSWAWLAPGDMTGWVLIGAADFNGDGHPDLMWQDSSTGQVAVWYMGGAQGNTYQSWDWLAAGSMSGWTLVGAVDLNDDGHPDLIWQNNSTQQVAVWYMGGAQGNVYQSWAWIGGGATPGTGWTANAKFN